MKTELPEHYQRFLETYPTIARAYQALGDACHAEGPLDEKARCLVKLGIAVGGRLEGAVHSHTRKALEAGATPQEIRQVVLLALPTVGFPSMMAALTWVEDLLSASDRG